MDFDSIISCAILKLNEEIDQSDHIKKENDNYIERLDSLNLIVFVGHIEDEIETQTGQRVILVDDDSIFDEAGPFSNYQKLCEFLKSYLDK